MDPILHFASNSVVLTQITHIHCQPTHSYTFAHHLSLPQFELPAIQTHVRRYYLNQRCLSTPWTSRKIGPLFVPDHLPNEPVKIYDYVVLEVAHSQKGVRGLSYLPPSWSNPLVRFFKYYTVPQKTRWMFETKANRQILAQDLVIPYCVPLFTLYHTLQVVVTKDWSVIVDMLRRPAFRQKEWKSFEEINQAVQAVQKTSHGVTIPSTTEFVIEVAFWAQDVTILDTFYTCLDSHVSAFASHFYDQAHEFLRTKDTTTKYMKRLLRQMSREVVL